jgi:putative intracellular protease/amidase
MAKVLMPLGDATEALDTFYPFFRLKEAGYEVIVAGPEARLYHTVLHEIPPDSSIPWDITQERPLISSKLKLRSKTLIRTNMPVYSFQVDELRSTFAMTKILTAS